MRLKHCDSIHVDGESGGRQSNVNYGKKANYKMARGTFLQMFEFDTSQDCQRDTLKLLNIFRLRWELITCSFRGSK